jgi:predicted phage terminase large subunit-like protein
MAALQYVHVPGYAAILFRKTYADLSLPGALMDRASSWLNSTDAKWKEKDKTWTFPSGATVTFAYLEHPNDRFRYQGSEYQFVGFDELTQFDEISYRYLFSRLRRLQGSKVPIRCRSASNPGGKGHEWVKQRFLVEGEEKGRIFVPATLEDNPYLDMEDYEESLMQLSHVERLQLRYGDWDAMPDGEMFKREWFKIVEQAPADIKKIRYWDLASTDKSKATKTSAYTAGALVGVKDGQYWVMDMKRVQKSPLAVEQLIRQTAEIDGVGTSIYMEQEPGSSGVNTIDHYQRKVLSGFAFYGDRPTGPKEERARPLSAAAEAGNVFLVRGTWIGDFLDEIVAFPEGQYKDQTDTVSASVSILNEMKDRKRFTLPTLAGIKTRS